MFNYLCLFLDLIRSINDPEHPLSLEELNVVENSKISVRIYFQCCLNIVYGVISCPIKLGYIAAHFHVGNFLYLYVIFNPFIYFFLWLPLHMNCSLIWHLKVLSYFSVFS